MYGRPSKRFRRIKPVARVGAIDINVRYDIQQFQLNRQKATDECFDVLEGEVLFKAPAGDFYRDNSLHVLSCFEGQYTMNADNVNVPNDFSVAGVAVTGFSPRTDVYEQGFVLQASGLTTIYNNSGNTINAGDEVFVVAPNVNAVQDQNPNGVPRTKKLLKLTTQANRHFLGTCVKGGPKKGTIDIVLHKAPKNEFQAAGGGGGGGGGGGDNPIARIGGNGGGNGGENFRPAAAAAPKRVKSKKAKAAK